MARVTSATTAAASCAAAGVLAATARSAPNSSAFTSPSVLPARKRIHRRSVGGSAERALLEFIAALLLRHVHVVMRANRLDAVWRRLLETGDQGIPGERVVVVEAISVQRAKRRAEC